MSLAWKLEQTIGLYLLVFILPPGTSALNLEVMFEEPQFFKTFLPAPNYSSIIFVISEASNRTTVHTISTSFVRSKLDNCKPNSLFLSLFSVQMQTNRLQIILSAAERAVIIIPKLHNLSQVLKYFHSTKINQRTQ